ncbi:PAS domain-containing sensor histidine kinase [Guptibacillus algicola]|uniref:PAS domain-containing sensor histidine kinase n=1 Tax=Guptibacillus algicola TaxID=225844 RepID=UPI001CD6CE63|nr:PAS domain-containing sensor histidine kinase [Alkalihalobacillus algicola]MCA0988735.1 PAS domain S-box protein [Alkalihalobacillus algicola]
MTRVNHYPIEHDAERPPQTMSKPMDERKALGDIIDYYNRSSSAVVIQKDWKWVYLNGAALKLLGYYTLSEIEGKSIWETIDESQRTAVASRIHSLQNGINTGPSTQKWIKQDGSYVYVEVMGVPIANELGQTVALIEEKGCEEKLVEETLYHYKLITENMSEIVSLLDHEGSFLYVSPSYRDYSRDGIENEIGASSFKYVHPDDVARVKEVFAHLVKYKKPVSVKYRLLRIDGQYRWFDSRAISVQNEERYHYIVVSRDITKQKLAEKKLSVSEQKHRMIVEHSSDLICLLDLNGVIVYASPSYHSLLDYRPEDVVGKDILAHVHPDDCDLCMDVLTKLRNFREPVTVTYRKLHASGEVLTFEGKGMPVIGECGEVNRFVVISRDITEKIKIDQYKKNIEKLSVVGELAAGFAHEIRTPLTSIKGFLSLLSKDKDDKEKEFHRIINDELKKLEEVVNGFISLGKPEAINTFEVNLKMVMENAISDVQLAANKRNITVTNHVNKPIFTQCRSDQIKQVFINVLQNAIDAIEHDNGEILISITVTSENISITIEDNGKGIDHERIEYIGTPFYTNKEKGVGLGMTVSNKIISEHNGHIEIESEMDKGTCVTILLPNMIDREDVTRW